MRRRFCIIAEFNGKGKGGEGEYDGGGRGEPSSGEINISRPTYGHCSSYRWHFSSSRAKLMFSKCKCKFCIFCSWWAVLNKLRLKQPFLLVPFSSFKKGYAKFPLWLEVSGFARKLANTVGGRRWLSKMLNYELEGHCIWSLNVGIFLDIAFVNCTVHH